MRISVGYLVTRRAHARDSNSRLIARLKYPDKIKSLDEVAPVLVTLREGLYILHQSRGNREN